MFLARRFYIVMGAIAAVLAAGVWWPPLFTVGQVLLVALAVAFVLDALALYVVADVKADRMTAERWSMGDDNMVTLSLANPSTLRVHLTVVDEVPAQLQWRDFSMKAILTAGERRVLTYSVRPTLRGAFTFGHVLVYASSVVGLLERRFCCGVPAEVKVYPSFLMLRRYELMAASDNLSEMGIKRVRRAGNNTEFEQIRDYVKGDDYRTINWKASARRSHLMVNVYEDERAQQVFSLIDKGRLMQQSHHGMTLLDYAINAALVLSYVTVNKHDKAGIITFADKMGSYVPAARDALQMQRILECLYAEQTTFGESDYSILPAGINRRVGRRSLMVLYTNFTDYSCLERQLPYLRLLNQRHRLLVVFFEDAELAGFIDMQPQYTEEYYQHVIGEKLAYERRLMANTLKQNGIFCLLTQPSALSVDVINKYIELKSRQLLG